MMAARQIGAVGLQVLHFRSQIVLIAPVQHRDVVPAHDQTAHDLSSHELCSANDHDSHAGNDSRPHRLTPIHQMVKMGASPRM